MPSSNTEYQREYRKRMKAKGYSVVQGIYAPDNSELRRKIREAAANVIKEYNNDEIDLFDDAEEWGLDEED